MSTSLKYKNSNITRAQAAELLNVSVRTIDRYIRSGKLSSHKVNRDIWLKKADVVGLTSQQVSSLSTGHTLHSEVDNVSEIVQTLSTPSKDDVFEKLYNKLQIELKEQRQRLEMANYRVGQLESQLKSSIPLIEHQKEKIQNQTITKWVLILILLTILSLQPLWLLKSFE